MEVTLHKHIGAHRNIIEFYDHGETDDWMWIGMELAEVGDLFDKIEADSGVSEDVAHVYFTQLINAISYMHSKGVGHRDIKPENILLSAEGNLKLADFGMATLFEYHGKRKMAVTVCGSPPYVAPEVIIPTIVDGKKTINYCADQADIWSCGVVLFVLLAGNTPWSKPIEGYDENGRANEFSEYASSKGRPNDELWNALPLEVGSLLRGLMRIETQTRFSLADVRRHPWYTRPNKYMDASGQLIDQLSVATDMFEALHVSFDADPFAGTQKSVSPDAMDVDQAHGFRAAFASTQPDAPGDDMLFDWERFGRMNISASQPSVANITRHSSIPSNFLSEEPTMSQFTSKPSVPLSRTQMARKFGDILPAQNLTRFYSTWTMKLLVSSLVEALSRLGIPTPSLAQPSAQDTEYVIKFRTQDTKGCPMRGLIAVDIVADGLAEVDFKKGSGDPLEWRRLFKRVAVLCKDAVYKPDG